MITQAGKPRSVGVNDPDRLGGIRGWLLVIVAVLAYQLIHGLVLTGGAIILYNDPSLAAREGFSGVPLGGLLLYVTTNLVLAIYAIVVLALMVRKRKAAIINCVILNLLWAVLSHCLASRRRKISLRHDRRYFAEHSHSSVCRVVAACQSNVRGIS